MAQVTLKNISKTYDGKNLVVKNVDFDIKDKEFLVLVGPSGCGKSTTLRMIAGLEEVSQGEIFIENKDVTKLPPKDRDIAMVFQNYALYPHMTVFENIAFGLRIRKLSKVEINDRVNEAAKILELTEYLYRKPKALSGGQRQRVALGRAIVRKPKVFLFDEPLSNLDAKLRVQMRTEISKLHKKLNATMIYVTHDQTEAMTMGDRIVVMKDGIVKQIESPLNLYSKPANKFVAEFIGSPAMNFIQGKVSIENNCTVFNSDCFTLKLKSDLSKLKPENINCPTITIGIRPEDIRIECDSENPLPAKIELIELLGAESLYYLNISGQKLIAKSSIRLNKQSKEITNVSFNEKNIHFFNNEIAI